MRFLIVLMVVSVAYAPLPPSLSLVHSPVVLQSGALYGTPPASIQLRAQALPPVKLALRSFPQASIYAQASPLLSAPLLNEQTPFVGGHTTLLAEQAPHLSEHGQFLEAPAQPSCVVPGSILEAKLQAQGPIYASSGPLFSHQLLGASAFSAAAPLVVKQSAPVLTKTLSAPIFTNSLAAPVINKAYAGSTALLNGAIYAQPTIITEGYKA